MTKPLALVTGASRGIGFATAIALADAGYDLVMLATDPARLEDAANGVRARGASAATMVVDLADDDALVAAVGDLHLDRLDLLVNNAAIAQTARLADSTTEEFTRAFAVNVVAVASLIRELTPALAAARGTVVNINSGAGRHPIADKPAYVASKFALQGLTDSLRLDLGPRGIRVVTVAPGPTDTRMQDRLVADGGASPEVVRLRPADVAATILHVVAHPGDLEYVSVRPPLR